MKISLLDQPKLIAVNKLKEVTSGKLMLTKMQFDPNGLMSNDIFGISKGDRKTTFAYINLNMRFIHPHIYSNILSRMFTEIKYIIPGVRRYVIIDGKLKESDDGWTGLKELYNHWDEINWSKRSSTNQTSINILKKTPKDMIFIDRFVVCPPAYRDIILSGTQDNTDYVSELNTMYQQLIRLTSEIPQGGIFASLQYSRQYKIQNTIVNIYKYFIGQMTQKTGLIKQYLIGKRTDYGVRSVITSAQYNTERAEDMTVDFEHSALPLSQACSLFYPFIEAWLHHFFTREIINFPERIMFIDDDGNVVRGTLKDPETQFTDKKIKKIINNYIFNPDGRFDPITIQCYFADNPDKVVSRHIKLVGKFSTTTRSDKAPMTVTELLYLAAVDVAEKRHLMISRYPVGTDKNIIFTKCRVVTTTESTKAEYNGKVYAHWPIIDTNSSKNVGSQFIDSLSFHNTHLKGMGGDYDGDQVSVRGIWSNEANAEADQLMNAKVGALIINGSNLKVTAYEVIDASYQLTRDGKNPKQVSAVDVENLLKVDPMNITKSMLVSIFANRANNSQHRSTQIIRPRYNTWDRMTVPRDYFYQGQPEIATTIGRFIYNKYIFANDGIVQNMGYINEAIDKNKHEMYIDKLGNLLLNDIIDKKKFVHITDRWNWLLYTLSGMLNISSTLKTMKPLAAVQKRKKELYKQYEKEIAAGDVVTMSKIENELLALAKEELKDDPGFQSYLSGNINFANNYKSNNILKGPVYNEETGKFDFIKTSFSDGHDIKDIAIHSNGILASQYPASIALREAGYTAKKLIALLQMSSINQEVEDCHTHKLVPIVVTKFNRKDMMWTYIVENDKLVLLTPKTIDAYIGKLVHMRSPLTCTCKKGICKVCAGELFPKLGITNIGSFAVQASDIILNQFLKLKHDVSVKLYQIDPNTCFSDI